MADNKHNPSDLPQVPPSDLPYESGYRKPPDHTKFAKGKSGNPKGRPRKVSRPSQPVGDIESLYKEICGSIVIDGEEQPISALEAMMRGQIKSAAQGDLAAMSALFDYLHRLTLQEAGVRRASQLEPANNTGGYLVVPAIMEADAWQALAMPMQAKLKRDTFDPEHGKVSA